MKLTVRLVQYIYCAYAYLVFVVIMFVVLPFVLVSLLFGKLRGGNMIYQLCRYWAAVWYFFIGIQHKEIYEHPHDR
ncbi:MAG: 1-acyl-sn-glycerol-3-phosphate acyltransferase, partial [Sediminibacterium sp.]|nr:1-acyl-sn-glycerol-3-phosphate acyltransferase [Sediminibacterium sp.]